ncbi:hypothetical protein [Pseudomonas benzenivorans]|uniref:Uncharacterized protein n=1 Tax=Pseudomonas benzenivorans TaxID=556533 RepID=A0ABY5H2V7_9PSED|nr:hypothetical protein [Pseudomonas benzenivorans]UTW06630.1 hypothetical protein KDW96_15835 [Pseudomonas benzenivorans]
MQFGLFQQAQFRHGGGALDGACGWGGQQGPRPWPGWTAIREVSMLGYLIDEKNSLQIESLSIFF